VTLSAQKTILTNVTHMGPTPTQNALQVPTDKSNQHTGKNKTWQ